MLKIKFQQMIHYNDYYYRLLTKDLEGSLIIHLFSHLVLSVMSSFWRSFCKSFLTSFCKRAVCLYSCVVFSIPIQPVSNLDRKLYGIWRVVGLSTNAGGGYGICILVASANPRPNRHGFSQSNSVYRKELCYLYATSRVTVPQAHISIQTWPSKTRATARARAQQISAVVSPAQLTIMIVYRQLQR